MKSMRFLAIGLTFLTGSLLPASMTSEDRNDFRFDQEKMNVAEDGIYVVSSFEGEDYINLYSFAGEDIWTSRFRSKIISWSVVGNGVIVFSKGRSGNTTYVTCLDRATGQQIWKKS